MDEVVTVDDRSLYEWIIYDTKVQRRINGLVNLHCDIRRSRVIRGDGVFDDMLADLIDDACEQGLISKEERYEVADFRTVVLRGKSRQDGSDAYSVVRIHPTAREDRINRIADNADIMRRITGKEVIPAAVFARIGDAQRELAADRGVTLIHVSFEDVKMIDTQLERI